MKKLAFILISVFIISCTSKPTGNFTVKGKITGLKKGTIYLEKFEDEKTVLIDSTYVDDGSEEFSFVNTINESEVFMLSLNKLDEKKITFFGEPGTVTINTKLNNFWLKPNISGSALNDILVKHDEYAKKFTNNNLDLIKEKFDALKNGNIDLAEEIESKRLNNLKRLYLFSTNYAIAHKDKAIAPFIATYRMEQATRILKQKVYNSLTADIKESKYGKELEDFLN